CLVNGEFSERLYQACKIYNPTTEHLVLDDGLGFNLERCKETIDAVKPDWVCMVQNETATGVANRVDQIAPYVKKNGGRVLLDAVSSLGGLPLDCNAWGVDVCTSASQKCLAAPPGLGFVALSEEAMAHIESKASIPTFGLNLKTYKKFHQRSETPYTPALSVFYALRQALYELEADGLEHRWMEHHDAGKKVRQAVQDCGFDLFAEEHFRSDTVTSFVTPRCDEIKKALAANGVQIAGGQGAWKGKMLRIAHIGPQETRNIDACTSCLKNVVAVLPKVAMA
ncbi:MAG TPA: aminotransferase class V-fold PLP-dependent enzyme, partial [Candidatus Norongarragalinales archaeon]|nr:aminotransferase class V-fold PLP-dependent enzyme [Candidatus Norongarragalinales archaeon]